MRQSHQAKAQSGHTWTILAQLAERDGFCMHTDESGCENEAHMYVREYWLAIQMVQRKMGAVSLMAFACRLQLVGAPQSGSTETDVMGLIW